MGRKTFYNSKSILATGGCLIEMRRQEEAKTEIILVSLERVRKR